MDVTVVAALKLIQLGKWHSISIRHVSVIGPEFVSKVYPVTIGISDELQVVRGNPFARRGNLS
jgi:hypothetical protein